MRIEIVRTSVIAIISCLAYAQSAEKALTFDVASVKPAAPPVPDAQGRIFMRAGGGGPGTKDPGRITYPYINLRSLLMNAYDVKSFQITGPAWLDTERFEVSATMPPDTTKEQFRGMLQNLLAERFKLAIHHETKELPLYALVVTKNGPKMKESVETPASKDDGGPGSMPTLMPKPKMGPDGFPVMDLPGAGLFMMMMPGRARIVARQQTMQDLATRLANQLSRPVTDETGLKAKYDFTLTFSPEGMNGPMGVMMPPPPPPGGGAAGPDRVFIPDGETPQDLTAALQSQLGLKMESKKGPVETIVIDHAEKTPIEN